MDSKHFRRLEIKDADKGQVSAVFSTFGPIDSDGDVTRPGAFDGNASVPISAYGHSSTIRGVLPVGKGIIRSTDSEAILDGQFFMDTTHGRDAFLTVKSLAEDGLGEWSYGYDPMEFSFGEQDGQPVRFLDKLKVHEVSPVLRGAGVGTRTLAAKGHTPAVAAVKAIRPHRAEFSTTRDWDALAVLSGIPADASVSDLRSVFAMVDGDPEVKASYRFPHHHSVAGPANIEGVMMAMATLNSETDLDEVDRKGVWEHLAAHMRDADREPLKLRHSGESLTLVDQELEVLVGAAGLKDSVSRVVALRAEMGKPLSNINFDVLAVLTKQWHQTGRELDSLLKLRSASNPIEDLAHEFARFIRSTGGAP